MLWLLSAHWLLPVSQQPYAAVPALIGAETDLGKVKELVYSYTVHS